ncbi:hypothetical protein CFC21_020837 [Triticum aestivum]|uniref:Uncharacterized protein n=3 Tax=Triticum TaxID=4564 RepID=A0A9R1PB46_TRITD|nr:hypothetical protein CFC21_020837 [Triticum aestivum]VAH40227.1 unnamed protein product [Triticum turgidum subsp. durum]
MNEKSMGHEFQNDRDTRCFEHLNLVRFSRLLEYSGDGLIIVDYVSNGNLQETSKKKKDALQIELEQDLLEFFFEMKSTGLSFDFVEENIY